MKKRYSMVAFTALFTIETLCAANSAYAAEKTGNAFMDALKGGNFN